MTMHQSEGESSIFEYYARMSWCFEVHIETIPLWHFGITI